jgi:hypothetical protein
MKLWSQRLTSTSHVFENGLNKARNFCMGWRWLALALPVGAFWMTSQR